MGSPEQAAQAYRAGMDLYSAGKPADAIAAFDRAMSLGNKSWKVQDAKAAALTKVGSLDAAFELASALAKHYGGKSGRVSTAFEIA